MANRSTLDTMVISFLISIGSVEVLTKTILYYFLERLWAHIHRIKLKLLIKSNGKKYEVKRVERSAVG